MYTYTDKQGKKVNIKQQYHGSVTIYLKDKALDSFSSDDVTALQRWAEQWLVRADSIMSREDWWNLSYSISFGMHPTHRYAS